MFGLTVPVPAHSVETSVVRGEVLGAATWSETSVHGGAPSGGVSSVTTQRDRFFIKSSDQRQMEIDLHGIGLGVMDGHRLTAIYGHGNGEAKRLVGRYNHTTQRKAEIPYEFNMVSGSNINGCVLLLLLFPLPAFLYFAGYVLGGVEYGFTELGPLLGLGSFGAVVIYLRRVTAKREATIEALRSDIRRHIAEA